MTQDIARIAYEGWSAKINDHSKVLFNKDEAILPLWEELSDHQKVAWRCAAVAVVKYTDEERHKDKHLAGEVW